MNRNVVPTCTLFGCNFMIQKRDFPFSLPGYSVWKTPVAPEGYLNAKTLFLSASLIFKGAALEGLSNRAGYLLPDFTVSSFT